MSEKEVISIRAEKEFKKEMDKRAKELGLGRTEFLKKIIQVFLDFDIEFIKKMDRRADGLNMPLGYVIQNMIIKRLAEEAAEAEIDEELGRKHSQKVLMEFQSKRVGDIYEPVTGEELFNDLKARKKQRLIQMEVQDLSEKQKMLSKELPDHEKEFLEKYRNWF